MTKCIICGSENIKPLHVKEMMIGLRETFLYDECYNCGHTKLRHIPTNLHIYYNKKDYYSFSKTKQSFFKLAAMKAFLKAFKYNMMLTDDISILDFGCGAGQFKNELNKNGFWNVSGYDMYMPDEIVKSDRDGQLANKLEQVPNKLWNLITLNHVFEHLPDPESQLATLIDMLKMGGKLIIRIPVIDSYAYRLYGSNWVQFDAPRHINLFTRRSIELLIRKFTNVQILEIYDDSYHFQFTGSELYKKGLSLKEGNKSKIKRLLNWRTYYYYFFAKTLNKKNLGDQIVIEIIKTR